jgi:hypothetical protein
MTTMPGVRPSITPFLHRRGFDRRGLLRIRVQSMPAAAEDQALLPHGLARERKTIVLRSLQDAEPGICRSPWSPEEEAVLRAGFDFAESAENDEPSGVKESDDCFAVAAQDAELSADGMAADRIALPGTDQYGAPGWSANGPIEIEPVGHAVLRGTRLAAVAGSTATVQGRTTETPGKIWPMAAQLLSETRTVAIAIRPRSRRAPAELVSFPGFTTTAFASNIVRSHTSSPEIGPAPSGA